MTRKLLSKKQFADKINRSIRHVERLIETGQGPPVVHVGVRAVAIDEDDADRWIEARRQIPPGWRSTRAAPASDATAEAGLHALAALSSNFSPRRDKNPPGRSCEQRSSAGLCSPATSRRERRRADISTSVATSRGLAQDVRCLCWAI